MRRVLATTAVLACTLAAASACGDDDGGGAEGSDADPKTIEITFADGNVTPSGERVEVEVDQPIDLVVTADEAGRDPRALRPRAGARVRRGRGGRSRSQIDKPGVVEVESHDLDQIIVQLEVEVDAWTTSSRPTGSGARRTCRSRSSWRSRARWRRWSSRSRCWRSPGGRRATTPRRAAARLPRGSTGSSRSRRSSVVAAAARLRACSSTPRSRRCFGQDLTINPFFGIFYVLLWVGSCPVVGAARPGLEGDQPGPHHQPGSSPSCPAATPTSGVYRLPRAARLLAGGARPVRVRLDRAGLPVHRPTWRRCGSGAPPTSR